MLQLGTNTRCIHLWLQYGGLWANPNELWWNVAYLRPLCQLLNMYELDKRSLSFFRVFLGILFLFDIFSRLQHFEMFYTEKGVFPIELMLGTIPSEVPYVFKWAYNETSIKLIFLSGIVSTILFTLGRGGFFIKFYSLFFMVSLIKRNIYMIHGAENILLVICFWILFLPLNEHFSHQRYKTLKDYNLPSFIYIFQVAWIYFYLIVLRDFDAWFIKADVLWYTLSSQALSSNLGQWMLQFPSFLSWISRFVFAIEIIAPLIVLLPFKLPKTKTYIIFLVILFHFSTFILMRLSTFPFVSIAIWLPILPSYFWDMKIGQRLNHLLNKLNGFKLRDFKFSDKSHQILFYTRSVTLGYCFFLLTANNPLYPEKFRSFMNIWISSTEPFRTTLRWVPLSQPYLMFTPKASQQSEYQQVNAIYDDKVIDLFTMKPPTDKVPENTRELYPSMKYYRFHVTFAESYNIAQYLKEPFIRYYCRQSKKLLGKRANEIQLNSILVVAVDYQLSPPMIKELLREKCP
jgi:hypothetical protein